MQDAAVFLRISIDLRLARPLPALRCCALHRAGAERGSSATMSGVRLQSRLKERENGFDLDFGVRAKLPEYDALRDNNMRHYFDHPAVQKHLWHTGQIDRSGRVIDLDKNKSKLRVIENEFNRAEQVEYLRQKEEADARLMGRNRRINDLRDKQTDRRAQQIKEEHQIRNEIDQATKEALGLLPYYEKKPNSSAVFDAKISALSPKNGH